MLERDIAERIDLVAAAAASRVAEPPYEGFLAEEAEHFRAWVAGIVEDAQQRVRDEWMASELPPLDSSPRR